MTCDTPGIHAGPIKVVPWTTEQTLIRVDSIDSWFPPFVTTDITDITDFGSRSEEDREVLSVAIRAIRGFLS